MLDKEFKQIELYFKKSEIINSKVSKSSVGWHLDHLLKVINKVTEAIKDSDPRKFSPQFSLKQKIVFFLGIFPRGKAKSPKRVLPPDLILIKDLKLQLKKAIENLDSINTLNEHCYFTHPIFKELNKKQTIKFLKLHTNHHLKIIKDILK